MEEIQIAVAEKAKKVIDKVVDAAILKIGGKIGDVAIRSLASLSGYKEYLAETNDRVSRFKTFANPSISVSLMDNFVEMRLQNGSEKTINSTDLIESLTVPRRYVVSASAGFGKSILMRYVSLCFFENPRGKIPVFIELRELNRITSPNIIAYMHAVYKKESPIEQEAFLQGLKAGLFLFIFDGFDEINFEIRSEVESQILNLSQKYRECSVIVSGRPNEKFESWREFEVLRICPMNKASVIKLIRNLDYDSGTKNRFVKKLRDGLFESHESFLSTPLLAILMLLNFQENAHIPDKIHIFYGKAFETLFHKHDALKEQYERQRKSHLRIDDFSKVFSVFCLTSYVQERVEFNEDGILDIITKSLAYYGNSASATDFLEDVTNSVCLIQKEGFDYHFIHRSFQEYFTALFLSKCSLEIRDNFIDQVADRYWDNVLPMLFDMASEQIEPTWVTANVEKILEESEQLISDGNVTALIKTQWSGILLLRDDGREKSELAAVTPGRFHKEITILRRFYPKFFSEDDVNIDFDILVKEFSNLFSVKDAMKPSPGHSYYLQQIEIDDSHIEGLDRSGVISTVKRNVEILRKIHVKCKKKVNNKGKFLSNLFDDKTVKGTG